MKPIKTIEAALAVMPVDDVDTDQIIPARFLTTTSKEGLADGLFADRRPPGWRVGAAEVLVAGHNFGCGSSREHAVWALMAWGFRAVISTGFADIFRANALKNGLLPVQVSPEVAGRLFAVPGAGVVIDLEGQMLQLPDGDAVAFAIEPFARECLLTGTDELDYLLGLDAAITGFEEVSP